MKTGLNINSMPAAFWPCLLYYYVCAITQLRWIDRVQEINFRPTARDRCLSVAPTNSPDAAEAAVSPSAAPIVSSFPDPFSAAA